MGQRHGCASYVDCQSLCSEQSIVQARASVMLYNNEKKEWEHSGGSSGMSRVHVYHHPVNNTYRIVGRKQQDHMVCYQFLLDIVANSRIFWDPFRLASVHVFVLVFKIVQI